MKYLLALAADIANGLFATIFASWITSTQIAWWHFLIGILFAMIPDLDAIVEIVNRRTLNITAIGSMGDHRNLFHCPLAFLLLGAMLAYFFPFWGTLFFVATALHFFNDFYGTGWGIKLFWPFSDTQYKLLGRRANLLKQLLIERGEWDTLAPEERQLRLVVSWRQYELPSYIARHGLKDWIEPTYLRPNWISLTEYTLFTIALITAVLFMLKQ